MSVENHASPSDLDKKSRSTENLRDIFNEFAMRAQKDHPQLKGEFLVVDTESGATYGEFELEKFYFLSSEILQSNIDGVIATTQSRGSQAVQVTADMGGWSLSAGHIIAYKNQPKLLPFFPSDQAQTYSTLFELYHELGHHVVKNALNNYSTDEGKNFSEIAADIYALLRLRQYFPSVETGFFTQGIKFARALTMVELGATSHYSSFAIEELERRLEKNDYLKVSPEGAAQIAFDLASQFGLKSHEQSTLREAFKPYRDSLKAEGGNSPEKEMTKLLSNQEGIVLKATIQYLSPASLKEDMRPEADARAKLVANAHIQMGVLRKRQINNPSVPR